MVRCQEAVRIWDGSIISTGSLSEKTFPEIPVENGVPCSGNPGDPVVVHAGLNLKEEEKSPKLLMAEDEEVTVSEELPIPWKQLLKKGQTVGTVTYRLQGETVKTFPVYLTEDVEKSPSGGVSIM